MVKLFRRPQLVPAEQVRRSLPVAKKLVAGRRIRSVHAFAPAPRRNDPEWLGSTRPNILFVVDPAIGRQGSAVAPNTNLPISGPQLKFLEGYCAKHNIPLKSCAITRAAPPVTAETWDSDKRMGDHTKEYHQEFADNVITAKPRLIVAMGKWAARQVLNKATKITQIRGTPIPNTEFDCNVFPMLGLSHVMRVPEVLNVFESDFATLEKIVDADYSLEYQSDTGTDYQWCTDLAPLLKRANSGEKLEIATDIEGIGLQWYKPGTKILTVQLTLEAGQGLAIPLNYNHIDHTKPMNQVLRMKLRAQLKTLLEHKNVAVFGHNFKFDYMMLKELEGIVCRNWIDDTQCLLHAVDENILNKSLADGTRLFVPAMAGYSDEFDRDPIHEKKTRMDKVPPDKMLGYGCGDTDATFRLRRILLDTLANDKKALGCYRKVVMPALRAFAKIENHGFTVDKKALREFEIFLRAYQKEKYDELLELIPHSIREEELGPKYQKRIPGTDRRSPASLTRPGFLRAMLFDHPDGLEITPIVFTKSTRRLLDESQRVPSTSAKEHLAYFKDDYEFVARIIEYTKNEKLLGTYVGTEDGDTIKGFYKYIFDNRIRPTYLLHRVVTGRTASADPNGQNFPKRGKLAKQYRRIFKAPPGYVYLEVDFSQLELRIAAILANDPTMLELYRQGADIHSATAAAVMGITLEEFLNLPSDIRDLKRFQAKAVNFGFLYGMGWRKFITYAKTEYDIVFTEEEAQAIQRAFFNLYSRLKPWHNAVLKYVNDNGFVRSLSGRVRHLPNVYSTDEALASSAGRMGINSPVQGFGSDLGLIALAKLVDTVDYNIVRPIGFIHDAIVCLVPKARAKEAAMIVKNIMETLPLKDMFGIRLPIPIIAEAAIGETMADMIEIKDAWHADDNVITFEDVREVDWLARAAKAQQRGEAAPPKPWTYTVRKKRLVRRLPTANLAIKRQPLNRRTNNGSSDQEAPARKIILRRSGT